MEAAVAGVKIKRQNIVMFTNLLILFVVGLRTVIAWTI
jgi:hypothetical protein